jgi:hypothetical protein
VIVEKVTRALSSPDLCFCFFGEQNDGTYASTTVLDDSLLQDADMGLFSHGQASMEDMGSEDEDETLDDALAAALMTTQGVFNILVL